MYIPVLMFHGVADNVLRVPYGFLLQPADHFEACMQYLAKNGFATITLQDLYDHLKSNKSLPQNSIVLTFDDGYLDNWVYVYPILKKYGLRGTIFVVTDFVDSSSDVRANLEDAVRGRISRKELKWWGYLSWAEMKKMEADGVIDVQSHTQTHTWYFKSDKIIDFHHPNDSYAWLAWNERPERKSKWVDEDQGGFVPYGAPVYEYGRSLGVRRYFEDPKLRDYMTSYVSQSGGKKFFDSSNWKRVLSSEAETFTKKYGSHGRYENETEYRDRLRSEIVDSKAILEGNLHKKIQFLCWPGGAHTAAGFELAIESGFLATTKGDQRNSFGNDPQKLHRTATYLDSRYYNMTFLKWVSLPLFVMELQSYRGCRIPSLLMNLAGNTVRLSRKFAQLSRLGA